MGRPLSHENGPPLSRENEHPFSQDYLHSLSICARPDARCAFVLAAFETTSALDTYEYARNKSELYTQYVGHAVSAFRARLWPRGHAATDYTHWFNTSTPYTVEWQQDYEPYVLLRVKHLGREDVQEEMGATIPGGEVLFDTHFLGFGWNKVAFTMELDALGYGFIFYIHMFCILHLLNFVEEKLT